jgi:hypothetical protein
VLTVLKQRIQVPCQLSSRHPKLMQSPHLQETPKIMRCGYPLWTCNLILLSTSLVVAMDIMQLSNE